jgi:adenylyltransferase/sulfurtransferase
VLTGADDATAWRGRHALWIAGPHLGGTPPCPACARAGLPAANPVDAVLAAVTPAVLGAVAATEIVKALVGAGASLAGRVLAWDAAGAELTVATVTARPACATCRRPDGEG